VYSEHPEGGSAHERQCFSFPEFQTSTAEEQTADSVYSNWPGISDHDWNLFP
jgi:hypothetical protein